LSLRAQPDVRRPSGLERRCSTTHTVARKELGARLRLTPRRTADISTEQYADILTDHRQDLVTPVFGLVKITLVLRH
jgi:hypothetical protein